MPDADRIQRYQKMRENALNALEQLSLGTQTTVSVENRAYSFADRNELLDWIRKLDRLIDEIKTDDNTGGNINVVRFNPLP